jgi:hypothetical protein
VRAWVSIPELAFTIMIKSKQRIIIGDYVIRFKLPAAFPYESAPTQSGGSRWAISQSVAWPSGKAHLRELEVDELTVRRLRALERDGRPRERCACRLSFPIPPMILAPRYSLSGFFLGLIASDRS